eukprot:3317776-Rhodomonas_salina.3
MGEDRHEELQRILAVSSSALHDHNMESYVKVIRGLHLKSRLHSFTPSDPMSANGFGDAMPKPQVSYATCLRACYEMPGTDLEHRGTRCCRARYSKMVRYQPTRLLCRILY